MGLKEIIEIGGIILLLAIIVTIVVIGFREAFKEKNGQ